VLEQDGYAALKGQLPPAERRGLVLIDPPYEAEAEFDAVIRALISGHERGRPACTASGTRRASAPGACGFIASSANRESAASSTRNSQCCRPTARSAMQGCGLAIVNPPWQLDLALAQLLPQLHALLAPDGAGGTRVEWLVPE
jgi:23S rRNA (adenine2030-N6)-methyltransferase